MTRKILYISGTRADYGLMRSVLHSIHNHPDLSLEIVVTGMHLMDEFGLTLNEIEKDGFSYHIVNVKYDEDTKEAMAIFIGKFIQELVPVLHHLGPDIILVLGDRGEMLAAAIAGAYTSIPVAHIHGGEVTGTVDDSARNAITKLAHIHFPATENSRERIIEMGEVKSRIFVVGAPGLDRVLDDRLLSQNELSQKYHINFTKPIILVVQHPVSLEVDKAPDQIRETLEAVVSLNIQTIVIYPNADAGGRKMINVIKEYKKFPNIKIFPNIPHSDYLSLLCHVSVLIGNSSSAIIEAPSFGLPVVNIGTRQKGRERVAHVIDARYDRYHIAEGIEKAINNQRYREMVKECKNPYGKDNTSGKICTILSKIEICDSLLSKS